MTPLRTLITSADPAVRDQALDSVCRNITFGQLLEQCEDLETFRRNADNLYERVRALFFLYAIHRFHLPCRPELPPDGRLPFDGYQRLLSRRFDEAIRRFLEEQSRSGPSDALSSALAAAYQALGIQTLANQVRRSVRGVRGNQWMFRTGHPADHPLRLRPELLQRAGGDGPFPVLRERTPVRMDLSHSGWSDIFFLGMDFPEGARVLNVSIDLGVHGRDPSPRPPIDVSFRVIDEPVLRLVSVDLDCAADISTLAEVFDFARDYLGLLKAAVIAAGLLPPGLEGSGLPLTELLTRVVGPGLGLELVSSVNNIPKGSRLAVSTNLLAALIAACMRATGQAQSLTGPLSEGERRLVAARAILGEWLGGSGGGWQDSGGVWPGIKRIEGVAAAAGDIEFGVSRGRLLPRHTVLGRDDVPADVRRRLQESLILVHGGMAQNVGPILEMVTEKYLLRSDREWAARRDALHIYDEIVSSLRAGDVRRLGDATTRNFRGPIQTIIPWATNHYTETLIRAMRDRFAGDFWGFWMLGGMSGGGMGFIVAPARKGEAQAFLHSTMTAVSRDLRHSMPFAMDPVVYDFAINETGTTADQLTGSAAMMPPGYYALLSPHWLRQDPRRLSALRRGELDRFGAACRSDPAMAGMVEALFDRMLPRPDKGTGGAAELERLLQENGFDRARHEQTRSDLRRGLIGLAQNRLPASNTIEDVRPEDVTDSRPGIRREFVELGESTLRAGAAAVVILAAGAGSRWTQGAGVVKALHPFCQLGGRHRTFLEVHAAKTRKTSRKFGADVPQVVTTGYLTQQPLESYLARRTPTADGQAVVLSSGRTVGLRMVPMVRDLRFAWEEVSHQVLDEQAQKVRDSLHAALIGWAEQAGEGSDYTDNLPLQCLHPVGHWYEIPNMIRNGTLRRLLSVRPGLKHLLVQNVDTLGTDLDPGLLGLHVAGGNCLTFEVIARRIEDRGGGLARVNGRVRLVEGLAMPREEDEFALSYYNTLTTWVDIERLLAVFGLTRDDLADAAKCTASVQALERRVPAYVTLKDVKKRWGHGQEDVYPVCQFERLWGDMTALPEVACGFAVVPRRRGQQLKDQAQLDGWLRDGSAAFVESLCEWD